MLVRYLGRESYGLCVTITGMAAWLSVTQGGIGQSLKNEIIRKPESAGALFTGAFSLLLGIVLAAGALLTAAVQFLPWKTILNYPAFNSAWLHLIVISLWIVLFTALLSLVRATYSAFQSEFKLAPALLIGLLVSFALIVIGINRGFSMPVIVSASLLANLIGLGCGLAVMPRTLGFHFTKPQWFYRAGIWFFLIEACTILIFQADVFLVNLILGQSKATVFALHFQLFLYVQTAVALIVSPYWAAFGEAWHAGDRQWVQAGVRRLTLATGLISAGALLVLLCIGRPLMAWWSHGQIEWNPALAALIGVNTMIQNVTGVYAMALGAFGIAREPARVIVVQAVLNVGLCLWLIRRYGIIGGAVGSLATYALASGCYLPWKFRQAIA